MTATFLITLDVPSTLPEDLAVLAADLQEVLDPEFDVISVTPWARQGQATPLTPDTNNI